MIKKILILCLFILNISAFSRESEGTDYQGDIRLFLKKRKWVHLLEFSYAEREVEDSLIHTMVGSRYRAANHWKLALFASRDYGVWHDGDGSKKGWADTSSRGETSLIAEADFRYLFSFKKTTVFSFRTRYFHNFFNSNKTLKFRPSLSLFYSTKWSYFLRYEAYVPLNYGKDSIYEHWFYLASAYKLNDLIRIGPYISLVNKSWWWGTGGQDHKSLIFGLSLNLYL